MRLFELPGFISNAVAAALSTSRHLRFSILPVLSKGNWKTAKAYRTGMNWNNPLLAISVVDTISSKSLPPSHSFCSIGENSLGECKRNGHIF
jgi:hypothetical protein